MVGPQLMRGRAGGVVTFLSKTTSVSARAAAVASDERELVVMARPSLVTTPARPRVDVSAAGSVGGGAVGTMGGPSHAATRVRNLGVRGLRPTGARRETEDEVPRQSTGVGLPIVIQVRARTPPLAKVLSKSARARVTAPSIGGGGSEIPNVARPPSVVQKHAPPAVLPPLPMGNQSETRATRFPAIGTPAIEVPPSNGTTKGK